MLIGLVKDNKEKKRYRIELLNVDDRVRLVCKCYFGNIYKYVDRDGIISLFKGMFECDKKFVKKENEYDVYLDSNGMWRYYKNGVEDKKKFFMNNGSSVISYNKLKDLLDEFKDKRSVFKKFVDKNSGKILAGMSICYLLCCGFETDLLDDLILYYGGVYSSSDVSSLEIYNYINESDRLTEEKKKIILNMDFFDDFVEMVDDDRNAELRFRLSDINVKYFSDEELDERSSCVGYYNPFDEGTLHIRNYRYLDAMPHEFIHLLSDNYSEFNYFIETYASIMAYEYYGEDLSYLSEVVNVIILMETIGPKPVLEIGVNGNDSYLVEEISKYLSKEDTDRLLSLFSVYIPSCENINEVNDEIRELLYKLYYAKYGVSVLSDSNIYEIVHNQLNYKEIFDRGYFSEKYIESVNEGYSYFKNEDIVSVFDACKEGLINEALFDVSYREVVSKEEYDKLASDEKCIYFECLYGFEYFDELEESRGYYMDGYIASIGKKETYTIEEALEKGYIYNFDYCKKIQLNDLSVDDASLYFDKSSEKIVDCSYKVISYDEDRIKPAHDDGVYNGQYFLFNYRFSSENDIRTKFPEQFEIEEKVSVK